MKTVDDVLAVLREMDPEQHTLLAENLTTLLKSRLGDDRCIMDADDMIIVLQQLTGERSPAAPDELDKESNEALNRALDKDD